MLMRPASPSRTGLVLAMLANMLLLSANGCGSPVSHQPVTSITGKTMGTTYSVKIVGFPKSLKVVDVKAKIDTLLETINDQMSTYRPDSELSRFNRQTDTKWFPVSKPLAMVSREAIRIGELSGGAFDVTVGPLVNLWSFGPENRPKTTPSDPAITAAKKRVGGELFSAQMEAPALRKSQADVSVDLSAIAKGYAVDRIAEYLNELNVAAYMVEIGGEVRCRGTKPDGTAWKIGIQSPLAGQNAIHRIVHLGNEAMATSGDYRNYFEEGGKRYSHTIDPRTGRPVEHRLASVSVIADSCMTADALATTIMVLGPDAGYNFAKRNQFSVLLLVKENGKFTERTTGSFRKNIQ